MPSPVVSSASSAVAINSGKESNNATTTTTTYFIDVENDRYPFCIVWTPIPMITWLLPFVGHMGICDSHGVVHDFAGPYFVSRDDLAFGRPAKYWCLHPSHTKTLDALMGNSSGAPSISGQVTMPKAHENNHQRGGGNGTNSSQQQPQQQFTAADMWDAGLYRTAELYRKQMYNFFCNNCHSFVGNCLEQMEHFAVNNPVASATSTSLNSSSLAAGGRKDAACGSGGCSTASSANTSMNGLGGGGNAINNNRTAVVGNRIIYLNTWTMVTLAAKIFFLGKYVSVGRFLIAHLPFMIIVALVALVSYWGKKVT